jgi:predicted lipoprotein with Yx(FWY)xxD motif
MKHPRATIATIGLSVAAIAGGVTVVATAGGSTPNPPPVATASAMNPSSTPIPTPAAPAAMDTIHTASATVAGATETILVDARGFPLYFYDPDTATKSMVSGELAFLWPPLDATAPTAVGAPGALKVVNTANGHQVTYNGHFLYTFRQDSSGVVTGQGVQNFFVATPGIPTLPKAPAATPAPAPAPVSSGSGGY